jgi:hypothetical protein
VSSRALWPARPSPVCEEETQLPAWLSGVQVKTRDIPPTLQGASAKGVLWQAAPRRFLLDAPAVARFLVDAGHTITIDPANQSEAAAVGRLLRMTPLAALLYQRQILAFHAAAAANSHGAILLAGDSGAGKSTLLKALLERGWTMLADELSAVDLDRNGKPRVWPIFPEIRLWQNRKESTSGWGSNWRHLPTNGQFACAPQPLRAIYWLTMYNADRIERETLEAMERFRAPASLAYNSHIADVLLDRVAYMRNAAVIAQAVPIYRLRRPRGKWTVEELADRVEAGMSAMQSRCNEEPDLESPAMKA